MTHDSTGHDGHDQDSDAPQLVSQPLPPEVPMPRPDDPPLRSPDLPDDSVGSPPATGPDPEWWRADPADTDALDPTGIGHPAPPGPDGPVPGPSAGHASGMEGIVAAHEIGAQIGEAISSHLPGAQPPSHRLDLRWMRLKYNVPGLALALLVTWGGRSSVDRMTAMVSEDGLLAPVGAVLLVVLVGLALMVLPIGSWLASALGHLVSAVAVGLVRLVKRAWTTPYVGYVLRLLIAVAAWSFAIAVGRVIWRGTVHFLTGA
ncbi:hypothetical protein ACF1FX_34495 [Streptomyces sp. NPDC014646]|uniref:hypothetical protein n=1 Tax=Streptomyces sp. NPDC014646 TaxID=3364877 RepID=UPI003701B34A